MATNESTAALLERLKGQIRTLEAQPRQLVMALRTGVPEVDDLGAFRLGAGVELCGEEASGRTTLALSLVAAAGRQQRLAAWVDGPSELYPPAALCLGVELSRLLIVRPRAPKQLVWSAVQLLRSGAFTCVVLDVTHTGVVPSLVDCKKLLDAARAGGSLLVLLTSLATPATGLVRLTLKLHRPEARPASGHLRVVEGGREEPGGVAYELDAPRGRRARVQRARLSRGEAPIRRAGPVEAAPRAMRVVPEDSLRRPRKNLERDGYGLCAQGRPGRDGPLQLPAPLVAGRSWQ
jgi:recombination protein RecA